MPDATVASTATHSYKTFLRVAPTDDIPADWTIIDPIAEVTDFTGPGLSVNPVKITHLLSPNAAQEYLPGLIEGGTLQFNLNYTADQQSELYFMLRQRRYWQITFPDAEVEADRSKWVLRAFIQDLGNEYPEDNKINQSCTLKLTGIPNFLAGGVDTLDPHEFE